MATAKTVHITFDDFPEDLDELTIGDLAMLSALTLLSLATLFLLSLLIVAYVQLKNAKIPLRLRRQHSKKDSGSESFSEKSVEGYDDEPEKGRLPASDTASIQPKDNVPTSHAARKLKDRIDSGLVRARNDDETINEADGDWGAPCAFEAPKPAAPKESSAKGGASEKKKSTKTARAAKSKKSKKKSPA